MKSIILVVALMAVLQNFSIPVLGMSCKAEYPINEKATIFPIGYFESLARSHPIE
jgi:hypothetical protein